MREIHASQEDKLLTLQARERAALEKAHAKTLKKASKNGSLDQIQKQNAEELMQLQIEHEEKVS